MSTITGMVSIHTGDYLIESLDKRHTADFVAYLYRNRQYFRRFEPCRPEYYYSDVYWHNILEICRDTWKKEMHLAVLDREDRVAGYITVSGITGYPMYSGLLGYSLDHDLWGRGIMTGILSSLVDYLFTHYHFHRLQADYMPENLASARLLEKLGFIREGRARSYLYVNGKWEDHVTVARIHPVFSPPPLDVPDCN